MYSKKWAAYKLQAGWLRKTAPRGTLQIAVFLLNLKVFSIFCRKRGALGQEKYNTSSIYTVKHPQNDFPGSASLFRSAESFFLIRVEFKNIISWFPWCLWFLTILEFIVFKSVLLSNFHLVVLVVCVVLIVFQCENRTAPLRNNTLPSLRLLAFLVSSKGNTELYRICHGRDLGSKDQRAQKHQPWAHSRRDMGNSKRMATGNLSGVHGARLWLSAETSV